MFDYLLLHALGVTRIKEVIKHFWDILFDNVHVNVVFLGDYILHSFFVLQVNKTSKVHQQLVCADLFLLEAQQQRIQCDLFGHRGKCTNFFYEILDFLLSDVFQPVLESHSLHEQNIQGIACLFAVIWDLFLFSSYLAHVVCEQTGYILTQIDERVAKELRILRRRTSYWLYAQSHRLKCVVLGPQSLRLVDINRKAHLLGGPLDEVVHIGILELTPQYGLFLLPAIHILA